MSDPVVWIIDDDEAVGDSLQLLLRTIGLDSHYFTNGAAFLEAYNEQAPGCAVVDLRMPGMSGLELQEELHRRQATIPIVFLTGHGTVDSAVHAMRAGAVDFLRKPIDDQELLDVIQRAVRQDQQSHQQLAEQQQLAARYESLTQREVMERVVEGQANKVIA